MADPRHLDEALRLCRADPGGGILAGPGLLARLDLLARRAGARPADRQHLLLRLEDVLLAPEPAALEGPEPHTRVVHFRRPRPTLHRFSGQPAHRVAVDRNPGHQSGRPPYRRDGQPGRSSVARNTTGPCEDGHGRQPALRQGSGRDRTGQSGPVRPVDQHIRRRPPGARDSAFRHAGCAPGLVVPGRPFRQRSIRQPVRRPFHAVLSRRRRDRVPRKEPVRPRLHAPGRGLSDEDMGGLRRAGLLSGRTF